MILADTVDAVLLDLDGVVWRGEQMIPGADEAVAAMRARGRSVVFVTNNSSRTPREYAVKLARMKIPTAPDDVVTSGHAVIRELRRIGVEPGHQVHVCGGDGIVRMLTHERFVPVTDEHSDARAVVVGWNPRGTYDDIRKAANLVRQGLPFIASNLDATYPAEGQLLPGTGAIVAAIEVASGRTCTAVGKPKPELFALALERAGADASRALFVGDRPETDIVGARAAGLRCALALTGVVAERDLGHLGALPDLIVNDLRDLIRDLPSPRVDRATDRVIASSNGDELASLVVADGEGVRLLSELRTSPALQAEAAWRVVRQLLTEAVFGAARVGAPADVRPALDRIGITAFTDDAQQTLPGLEG